jgi:hypothetical protein
MPVMPGEVMPGVMPEVMPEVMPVMPEVMPGSDAGSDAGGDAGGDARGDAGGDMSKVWVMLEVESDVENGIEGIRRGVIGCVACVGRAYFTGRDLYQCGFAGGDTGPFVRATYVHLGRTAAIILAPSTPRLFDARLRLVVALVPEGGARDDVSKW